LYDDRYGYVASSYRVTNLIVLKIQTFHNIIRYGVSRIFRYAFEFLDLDSFSDTKRIRRTRSRLVARATLIRHYERRWRSSRRRKSRGGDVRLLTHQRCARTLYVSYHFMPCKCMYARALVKAYHREAPWAFSALAASNDDHFYSFFSISEVAMNLFESRRR